MLNKFKTWNRRRVDERRVNKLCQYIRENVVDDGKDEIIRFLNTNKKLAMLPYLWTNEYDKNDVAVEWDDDKKLYYALWNGKKMYWKSGVPKEKVQEYVNDLRIEQDSRSPHLYTADSNIDNGVLCDCGSAEGCFSLDVIERVKHVYLFECDEEWMKALQATFEPWKEKVTLVNKYIGSEVGDNVTTLDAFFADRDIDVVKADIEGAECDLLSGGKNVLAYKVKAVNICLYHKYDDEAKLGEMLTKMGFTSKVNPGFMIYWQHGLSADKALRRGVMYAKK